MGFACVSISLVQEELHRSYRNSGLDPEDLCRYCVCGVCVREREREREGGKLLVK